MCTDQTASTSMEQNERTVSNKTPTRTEPKLTRDVSELVIKIASPRKPGDPHITKDEEVVSLHIWDFAGHELYYTTHQVSLTIYSSSNLRGTDKQVHYFVSSVHGPKKTSWYYCMLIKICYY